MSTLRLGWFLVVLGVAVILAACGGGGGGASPATDDASLALSPRQTAQRSGPGDFAADFLRAERFRSIVVEVDHPAGRFPDPAALELLRARLAERCDKPAGVEVLLDDEIPGAAFPADLGASDLETLEDDWRDTYADAAAGVAALYVLFVPGASDRDSSAGVLLGLAYRGASVAVFLDNADQGEDRFVTTAEVVGTTLVHEAGHLLGLVDSGVPMVVPHEDPEHPGHDADPSSILHWAVVVPRVAPNLGDPDFAQFGAACIQDLRAFGGT